MLQSVEELIRHTSEILSKDLKIKDFEVKDCSTRSLMAISFRLPIDREIFQNHIILEQQDDETVKYLVRSKAYDFNDKYFDELDSAVRETIATYLVQIISNMQYYVISAQKLGMTKGKIIQSFH